MERSLKLRIASAIVLAPLTIAVILAGSVWFGALMGVAVVLSLYEWAKLSETARRPYITLFAGTTYILVSYVSYIFLRFGFDQGAWLALCAMISVWFSDTGAYFTGRKFGGPKLAPKISPNKTWSGFCGAMFFSGIAIMVLAGLLHIFDPEVTKSVGLKPAHVVPLFFMGAGLGATGQAGDLLISFFKRQAGIKDTGGLIPGHGGLLDRIDSILLVSPVFFVAVNIWMALK